MKPVVSIVGRPNVGKSALFNRLISARKAIVDDAESVTRDRHYGETYWSDADFTVVDTGGYVPEEEDVMLKRIREQVHVAIEESDVILFTVDVQTGITSLDREVANMLRQQEKPVLLVANKADSEERRMDGFEFYELGFDEIYPVSSINGMGTGDMLDALVDKLPREKENGKAKLPRLAILGRPNVGKSSYINALLDDERCIVTDIPGTTRDAINSRLHYNNKEYMLIDTAGLRKSKNIDESVEFYSTLRTERAIKECDVSIVMVDAMQGFEKQDKRIVNKAVQFNKGVIIALNKWDLVPDKTPELIHDFEEYIYDKIPQHTYIPIVTVSSTNRTRLFKVIDIADYVMKERQKKVDTNELNKFIREILKDRPLPFKQGRQLKITYATQVKTSPPVFKFFMNSPEDLPKNHHRYIETRLRERYRFDGVPLTMVFRQK